MVTAMDSASPTKKAVAAAAAAAPQPPSSALPDMADAPPHRSTAAKKKRGTSSAARWSAKGMPWDTLVEGKMSDLPVVFTRDADYFFLVSKTSIKIYSRTTGQVVSTLSTDKVAHSATITGMMLNPSNPLQLITSSLDGHLKVWDFLDGILLKSFDVGFPITALAAHEHFKGMVFVAVKKLRHESEGGAEDAADSKKKTKKKKNATGKKAADALEAGDDDASARYNSIIYTVSLTVPATAGGAPQVSFASGASVKPELVRIGKTREAASLGISPNGQWLVVIGNRKVQVARTSNLRAGFTKFVTAAQGSGSEPGDRLTCMAFHPTEESRLVTGDDRGRIRVWYCLDDKYMADSSSHGGASLAMERHAPSSVLHWHAHAVSSLAFTPNGAHLLSGGEEGVLVVWQLVSSGGNGASKEFVPRLGAPITTIAIANGLDGREQEYALGLADGTVTFVGSMNLKPTRTFSRIKIDASRHLMSSATSRGGFNSAARRAAAAAKAHGLPLAVHPSTGNLVLPSGHPSSIQFYDAEKDVNAMELEVAPSNRVSRADDDPIEPTRVEKVVFSTAVSDKTGESGEWMVTFDSRNLVDDVDAAAAAEEDGAEDEGSDSQSSQLRTRVISESSLKFWRWDLTNRRYVLNTRIDRPHNGKRLTSITFSPSSDGGGGYLLVTTGRDGKTRTWSLSSRPLKSGRTESYWTCRSCFQYRDSVPLCSSFSPDGSLLAVGQGSFVTFWQPEANLLQMTLSCPELRHRIKQVKFIGPNGRWVVVASAHTVVVWDLVLGRVCWRRDALGFGPLQSQLASWTASSATATAGSGAGIATNNGAADEPSTTKRSTILAILDNDKDSSTFCIVLNRARENRTLVEVYATPNCASVPTLACRPVERYSIDGIKLRQAISAHSSSVVAPSSKQRGLVVGGGGMPSFVGLTQSYDLMRLGRPSSSSSSTASGSSSIRGISGARKTLFDDLFGPTLLTDSLAEATEEESREGLTSSPSSLLSPRASGEEGEAAKGGIERLFTTPPHLLPPLTSLLDAFVERILPPSSRGAGDGVDPRSVAVGGGVGGEKAKHPATIATPTSGGREAGEEDVGESLSRPSAAVGGGEGDLQAIMVQDLSFLSSTFRALAMGREVEGEETVAVEGGKETTPAKKKLQNGAVATPSPMAGKGGGGRKKANGSSISTSGADVASPLTPGRGGGGGGSGKKRKAT